MYAVILTWRFVDGTSRTVTRAFATELSAVWSYQAFLQVDAPSGYLRSELKEKSLELRHYTGHELVRARTDFVLPSGKLTVQK